LAIELDNGDSHIVRRTATSPAVTVKARSPRSVTTKPTNWAEFHRSHDGDAGRCRHDKDRDRETHRGLRNRSFLIVFPPAAVSLRRSGARSLVAHSERDGS
jgi:hypothetical protein